VGKPIQDFGRSEKVSSKGVLPRHAVYLKGFSKKGKHRRQDEVGDRYEQSREPLVKAWVPSLAKGQIYEKGPWEKKIRNGVAR